VRPTTKDPAVPDPTAAAAPLSAGRTGDIAWWASGAAPRLALLHGFTDDAGCWAPVLPSLAGLGDVLAIDARGHGASGLPDGPIGPGPHAADVAAVLDDLRPERPVVLLGHSMGAVTAAKLAAVRPDLVAALVLEDPPPYAYPEAGSRGVPDWLTAIRKLSLDARIAACRLENPAWPADELAPWAASKDRVDLEFCERAATTAAPLAEVLAETACPTLLLHGAPERGGMISASDVAELRAVCGERLTVVQPAEAGHNVRRDARAAYVAALSAWLEAGPGSA
jgi:pimeloyl-ACP methyl ester carboxylesterase